MKKIIASLSAAAFLILPFNGLVQAEEKKVESTVHDKAKVSSKSFSPASLNPNANTLAAAPYYAAKSTFSYSNGGISTSDSYTSSSRSSKKSIDYIYAKAKIYVNGIFKTSSSEGNYNSSHAGAQGFAGETWFEDGETYGNHKFQHSGYQTWEPDTYGT
ncbi:hypothetical protein BWGOE4_56770 [Bacillus mycoides]|uniref:XoxI protein n=3 Tax=Bacillus TaxID=1386 RepID=A0A1D3MX47_BACMY|nr:MULTISPECIES: hypothetical protein [Bacillus cereus group]EJV57214.1 hypothetical protein IEM_04995 [Bacillus cereus BAG6O-2]MBJ8009318.1 hypothetical protein [Bacillus cereus]MBJ8073288.1 hypothetical protein [Bacillus cereus]MBJ8190578.1 hypothetical protein [Bacillus cereus]MDM5460153.1 hypothetical protein [Bacillus cereus]